MTWGGPTQAVLPHPHPHPFRQLQGLHLYDSFHLGLSHPPLPCSWGVKASARSPGILADNPQAWGISNLLASVAGLPLRKARILPGWGLGGAASGQLQVLTKEAGSCSTVSPNFKHLARTRPLPGSAPWVCGLCPSFLEAALSLGCSTLDLHEDAQLSFGPLDQA